MLKRLSLITLICAKLFAVVSGVAAEEVPAFFQHPENWKLRNTENWALNVSAAKSPGIHSVLVVLAEEKGTQNSSGKRQSQKNRAHVGKVLNEHSGLVPTQEFGSWPGFSAEATEEELWKLLSNPAVVSLEPNTPVELHGLQGNALMNATSARLEYGGAGTTIAVLDTGVDYFHPQLGGGQFPNAKVTLGVDIANNDNDPLPRANPNQFGSQAIPHGTYCAGIAAGLPIVFNDYIGGAAPSANIAAVKVFEDGSGGSTIANIAAGIDWCVANQFADPENPIRVISMSLGGLRFFGTCDASNPTYLAAITAANNAGITVLASSGNNGYCDSMGAPACVSGVIAVGGTYDAAFGNLTSNVSSNSCHLLRTGGNTVTEASAAFKVTPYSNSSDRLDLFGPAHNAYTTALYKQSNTPVENFITNFGGTSAAVPYIAGLVAVIQEAAFMRQGAYLSPVEVKSLLVSTGISVTDVKGGGLNPGLTRPFPNAENALAALGNPLNEALDLADGVVAVSGAGAPWVVDSTISTVGEDSARSGVPAQPGESSFSLTAPPSTRLKFRYRVSSEQNGDFLRVFRGAQQILQASGEVDWTIFDSPIAGGEVIRFTYSKNGSGSAGSDAAWIDGVEFLQDFPPQAILTSPAEGELDVPFEGAFLIWNEGGTAPLGTTYDLYLGTRANQLQRVAQGLTTEQYSPLLSEGSQYFWRVDSFNPFASTQGVVWSFRARENQPPSDATYRPVLAARRITPSVDPEGQTPSYKVQWTSSGPDAPVNQTVPATTDLYLLEETEGRTFTPGEVWTLRVVTVDSWGDESTPFTARFVIEHDGSIRFEGWAF